MYKHYPLLALLFVLFTCTTKPQPKGVSTGCLEKTCLRQEAMVVTAHPEASRVGVEVLRRGGTALDAAIAVQFALAVVYPNAGNIGGGGFLVYRQQTGEAYTLDFREKAPLAASPTMYLDETGEVIPNRSIRGHLAAGVPGSVEGMWRAHERFGSLPWEELLAPAVQLAEKGFAITERQAREFNQNRADFLELNADPAQVALLKEGSWQKGDQLVQPLLAATLQRIQQQGRDGFYKGETARLLVADMQANGGLITEEDLDRYEAVWREPLTGRFGAYRIIGMGPPSSGGLALLQLLKMSEHFPLQQWGHQSVRSMHAMAEMERRVYLDRSRHLADPDFWEVPVARLLDSLYLLRKAQAISLEGATPSHALAPDAVPAALEQEETTHFSIVDARGNAVSLTTTLNGSYGAKTFVKGAGFLLNNEMDDFSIKPGHPNMYGIIGSQANAIAPGKRMLSSMTPTIIEKGGEVYMVVGTPGGSTIITSVYQAVLGVLVHDMSMTEAVWAGRFHHQWLPDEIQLESGQFSAELQDSLRSLGHTLRERPAYGRINAILRRTNGQLEGAADPRGDDIAAGY
ncbi:gamma-glutamyltransferase [Cesiribacter andamanensis]|uniref:Glutathione hydrolase proenzyme n=1 Tax=Cesiribacter andamanensis AMV16 TaxID=1279009 RepID=M7N4R2_9BACT|nr:gamma-glutamyltransferase [Cesiribacter andamanensis]EMR02216.1 Gamma-glutamyltranspeptidase precursor [Cesiribacter andamanensis AMV16]